MDKAKASKVKVWQIGLIKPVYTYKTGAGTIQSFTQTLTSWKWEVLSFSSAGVDVKTINSNGDVEYMWIPAANISYIIYQPTDASST